VSDVVAKQGDQGPMLWFFKYFRQKIRVFDSKQSKILIITLVFEKNANFFAENCRKSQKIVIITSTPDEIVKKSPKSVQPNPFFVKITT
jgi:hypothetical protein